MYYNKARNFSTLVHGDDYALVGSLANLRWLKGQLGATFEMKAVIAGHSDESDVVREAKILNRIIRATPDGWEYECDQRHAEIMIKPGNSKARRKSAHQQPKSLTREPKRRKKAGNFLMQSSRLHFDHW